MIRDDIIRMAEQADGLESIGGYTFTSDGLQRFAALVAAAEREACAQIADEVGDDDEDCHAWTAADAIRARGDE